MPYHSFLQPYGAWSALVAFVILTLINGFDVFFPGGFNANSFLTAYVGVPWNLLLPQTFALEGALAVRP
jgi:amino acid transporter